MCTQVKSGLVHGVASIVQRYFEICFVTPSVAIAQGLAHDVTDQ